MNKTKVVVPADQEPDAHQNMRRMGMLSVIFTVGSFICWTVEYQYSFPCHLEARHG